LPEDLRCADMRGHHDAVVHPLTLAPGRDDAGVPQIRKMAGNLWLRCAQNFNEIADADFLLSHEVEEAQAGGITESLKEAGKVEQLDAGHD